MRGIDWSFTDKIVFINLEKRTDRRLQIEACLKRFGAPEANILRFRAIEDERGAIGCARSHIEVLKMAQAEKCADIIR